MWSVTTDCFGSQAVEVWCCNLHTFICADLGWKKKRQIFVLEHTSALQVQGAHWNRDVSLYGWLNLVETIKLGCACFKPIQSFCGKGVFKTWMCLREFCVHSWVMCKALCKCSWLMKATECLLESAVASDAYFSNLFIYIAGSFDFYKHLWTFSLKASSCSSEAQL